MKKKYILFPSILILILAMVFYKIFIRGTVQDVDFLKVGHVEASDHLVKVETINSTSGLMLTGIDHTYKNHTVYLKFKGAPVNRIGNPINEKKLMITGNFPEVEKVVLVGEKKQKTIWAKN